MNRTRLWIAGLVIACVFLGVEDIRLVAGWPHYKIAHGCKVIGFEDIDTGSTVPTSSPDDPRIHGNAVYRCDNGKEFLR